MIVAQVASPISGQSAQPGHEMVERVLERGGIAQDQGTLAEIVEHEAGQDQAEPGEADRVAAEMAHVGVERLRPGDREHDRTQGHERLPAGQPEQAQRVARVEGGEHGGVLHDLGEAEQPEGREPDQHHGPEEPAHAGRAAALQEKQAEQHDGGDRDDVGLERGCRGLQTLHRRQHRDRGRDQAVAVEQGQAGDRQGGDEPAEAGVLGTAWEASVPRAITPPSPRLSARRISTTYLTVTTRISDQNTSERTPSTAGSLRCKPPAWPNASRSV